MCQHQPVPVRTTMSDSLSLPMHLSMTDYQTISVPSYKSTPSLTLLLFHPPTILFVLLSFLLNSHLDNLFAALTTTVLYHQIFLCRCQNKPGTNIAGYAGSDCSQILCNPSCKNGLCIRYSHSPALIFKCIT